MERDILDSFPDECIGVYLILKKYVHLENLSNPMANKNHKHNITVQCYVRTLSMSNYRYH